MNDVGYIGPNEFYEIAVLSMPPGREYIRKVKPLPQ
jgi:hypothetical protein